eukprot:gene4842-biopygen7187
MRRAPGTGCALRLGAQNVLCPATAVHVKCFGGQKFSGGERFIRGCSGLPPPFSPKYGAGLLRLAVDATHPRRNRQWDHRGSSASVLRSNHAPSEWDHGWAEWRFDTKQCTAELPLSVNMIVYLLTLPYQ